MPALSRQGGQNRRVVSAPPEVDQAERSSGRWSKTSPQGDEATRARVRERVVRWMDSLGVTGLEPTQACAVLCQREDMLL